MTTATHKATTRKPPTPSMNGKTVPKARTDRPPTERSYQKRIVPAKSAGRAPAARVVDDRLRLYAGGVIHDEACREWFEETKAFLCEHLGYQSMQNDRQDLAGLKFLTAAWTVLERVAGVEG